MTTITFRDGVVAVDGRSVDGDWIACENTRKLFRVRDGTVAAVVGNYARGVAVVDWLKAGGRGGRPNTEGTTVLVFSADLITAYENGGRYDVEPEMLAWGSGAPVALGAMYAGASAMEAVKIAARVDPYTGNRVTTMSVA